MLGRRRRLPDIHSTDPKRRRKAERQALNAVVQGSAADLVLKAAAPWRPETHPLRSASARARAVELVRVGHLLSISGASLNRGIRTWLRSRVGRAFWLQVMSYVDMGGAA